MLDVRLQIYGNTLGEVIAVEMDIMEELANFAIKTGHVQSHLLLEHILLITVLVKTYQEK